MDVRSIITEACTRVNIVPRRQAVPGDIQENAYRLLKGVIAKYNYDDLLVWTQKSIIMPKATRIHVYDETDTLHGEHNLYFDNIDDLNSYALTEDDYDNRVWAIVKNYVGYWTVGKHNDIYLWSFNNADYSQRYQEMRAYEEMIHIQVRDMAKINSVYVITSQNQEYKEYFDLEYVNHTDYDKYNNSSRVFTYTQKSEGEWVLETKPLFYPENYRLKVNYNEAMEFDIDSDLFIPENYIELLTVALAHKLALMYPRLDEAQMNRLEKEVQVLVDNVRTPKAEDRVLERSNYWDRRGRMTQADLVTGRYIF